MQNKIHLRPQVSRPYAGSMMPSGHSHSQIAAFYLFVINHLSTTAIVAGEVTSRGGRAREPIEGVIMNFKQKLMACTALLGALLFHPATAGAQSADSAKIERLERQTELLQRQLKETSVRARANAKEDRAGGSEGRSRAGALFGPAAYGYQGPATAASAGQGEGDAGRLRRRGDGVAPTQHGQRHWNGVRDNPVSVFTALQRARISRDRPAEPHLAARRGQHRPLPEAQRLLRVGLPGRWQHIELQPEQQLGSAPATRLFHL